MDTCTCDYCPNSADRKIACEDQGMNYSWDPSSCSCQFCAKSAEGQTDCSAKGSPWEWSGKNLLILIKNKLKILIFKLLIAIVNFVLTGMH